MLCEMAVSPSPKSHTSASTLAPALIFWAVVGDFWHGLITLFLLAVGALIIVLLLLRVKWLVVGFRSMACFMLLPLCGYCVGLLR